MTISHSKEMKKVLVTGAKGFIGKNLVVALKRRANTIVWESDVDSPPEELKNWLSAADVVYHLAGINRPEKVEEYEIGNAEFTKMLCATLCAAGRMPTIVLTSSTQATQDNPYGLSKRKAEQALFKFGKDTGAPVHVYRLPGVFGKWCRPNYNSVVATFCYNMARDLPVSISNPANEIELVYVDDVVSAFSYILDNQGASTEGDYCCIEPTYRITLGALAESIQGFRSSRTSLIIPDMNDRFMRCLYSTYVSYLPDGILTYPLNQHRDNRGELAELLKSPSIGQMFVSHTRPGITRGNHYHNSKTEKFIVVSGDAMIRLRHVLKAEVIEYQVCGREFRVMDIPPGYTHAIENVGNTDLVVLFWSNEVFDPERPDTIFEMVQS